MFLKIFHIYCSENILKFKNKIKISLATNEAIISLGSHSNLRFYFHMKCCWGYDFCDHDDGQMKRDPKIHIFIFENFFFFLGLV